MHEALKKSHPNRGTDANEKWPKTTQLLERAFKSKPKKSKDNNPEYNNLAQKRIRKTTPIQF